MVRAIWAVHWRAVVRAAAPVTLALLARTVLKEPISRGQVVGLAGSLGAIALIVTG